MHTWDRYSFELQFWLKIAQNFPPTFFPAPVNQRTECVMSVCPATYSFIFLLFVSWCFSLGHHALCSHLFILLWCHVSCNDAHEPSPLPCTAHIYDHWFEWQPYLCKQISFIWFVGLQWTRLQLCLLLILCKLLVWIEF